MLRSRTGVALSLLALLLIACERGPDTASVRADLQGALDGMDDGLLRVIELKPQGTGPASAGDKLVSYSNVSLELQRDHDFGSWNGPTVGTLVSILGATAKGVSGIKDGGNAAGDRFYVYASAVYALDDGTWRYLGGGPPTPDSASPTGQVGAAASLVAQLEAVLARGQANEATSSAYLAERELAKALADIQQQIAQAEAGSVFASGPMGGEYAKIALGLSELAAARGLRLAVYHSDGSVENARLVHSGDVALGIVQSDVLALAYAAEGPFATGEPLFDIVALAALYPEPVHVIVPADSVVTKLDDLAGKRVAMGGPASGTRLTAQRVLEAHGMQLVDLGGIDDSDLETAAARLVRGDIDAMFATIGAPAGELRRLAVRRAIRLLPLDDAAVGELITKQRSYVRYVIPRSTYRGQLEAVPTVATTAVLVAPRSTLDSLVESVLQTMFFEFDYGAAGSLQGGLISPQTAMRGLPLPLHLAAQRFYADLQNSKR